MSGQTLDTLAARIDTLERQNRWLKLGAAALAATGLCAGAAAQTLKPVAVVGDRFMLVDTMDRTRATLENRVGTSATSPVLTFLDDKGQPRLRLGLGLHGAALLETIDERQRRDFGGPAFGPRRVDARFKLTISARGRYSGWQIQKNARRCRAKSIARTATGDRLRAAIGAHRRRRPRARRSRISTSAPASRRRRPPPPERQLPADINIRAA